MIVMLILVLPNDPSFFQIPLFQTTVIIVTIIIIIISCPTSHHHNHHHPPHRINPYANPTTHSHSHNKMTSTLAKTCFLEFAMYDANGEETKKMGRVTITMFPNAPKTVENFATICNGFKFEQPFTNRNGEEITSLHYKGNKVHRMVQRFVLQMGEDTKKTSIWGGPFQEEAGALGNYHARGRLSMANAGKDTQTSQFFICLDNSTVEQLDGKHGVFGIAADQSSLDVIDAIAVFATRSGQPDADIRISDCGVVEYFTEEEVKNAKRFY